MRIKYFNALKKYQNDSFKMVFFSLYFYMFMEYKKKLKIKENYKLKISISQAGKTKFSRNFIKNNF